MYITYADYQRLGYRAAPEAEFERYNAMAEAVVRKRTQNRIKTMSPPVGQVGDSERKLADAARLADLNQRGMCEIIDLYYIGNNPQSDAAKAKQVITGYSNGKYSESYMGQARSDVGIVAPERMDVGEVLATYFTADQLYRGFE